jgi:hypothetical protein
MFTKNLSARVLCVCSLLFVGVVGTAHAQDLSDAEYIEMVISAVRRAVHSVHFEAIPSEIEPDCVLPVSNPSKLIKGYKEELKKKDKPSTWIKLGNLQMITGLECDAVKSFEKGGDLKAAAKAKAKCQ